MSTQSSGSSCESQAASQAEKKKPFRFNEELDLQLARETVAINPFASVHGKTQWKWNEVAKAFGNTSITWRTCRDRVNIVLQKHRKKQRQMERESGIDEEVTEFDELLQEISDLQEAEIQHRFTLW